VFTGLQLRPQRDAVPQGLDSYLLQRLGGSIRLEYPFGRYARMEFGLSPQALRALDFGDPGSDFAAANREFRAALQASLRLALDNTRAVAGVGPTSGLALSLSVQATQLLRADAPFGNADGARWLQPLFGRCSESSGPIPELQNLPAKTSACFRL
jgi:hypothetical protein